MTHDEKHSGKHSAYETVAEAIRFVRARTGEQPTLEEVAGYVGLSLHHLQRVFSDWAGISPKRFLQFLTKEHAKELLRRSHDVLSVAADTGLSGPGRLHDLMVACEAMTPGEIGSHGEGLTIVHGFADSPFGPFLAGTTARGVCHLRFVEPGGEDAAEAELRAEWPKAAFVRDDAAIRSLSERLFRGGRDEKPLRVLLRGTNFQVKVWEALLRVPPGRVVSDGDLAAATGNPKAARAAGSAVGQNRIAVLVPCHRVIRESGDFGQYRWGSERKAALLAWESAAEERPGPRA